MDQNHPKFANAKETIRFLRCADRIFDVFNTMDMLNSDIYKKAMHPGNKRIIMDFLLSCVNYFKTLSIDVVNSKTHKVVRKLLLESPNKTAFWSHSLTRRMESKSKCTAI